MVLKLEANGRLSREVDLVVIDWSGTVSDDRQPVYEAYCRMFRKRDLVPLPYNEWVVLPATNLHQSFEAQGITCDPEDLAAEYHETYRQVRAGGLHPKPYGDATTFFMRLKDVGKPVIVVSAHPSEHLLQEAAEYGIAHLIGGFVCGVHDKAAAIREQMNGHQVVVYIGDTTKDMTYAWNALAWPIGITTGYHRRDQLEAHNPVAIVDCLTDCLRLFGL